MKPILLLLLFSCRFPAVFAQADQWTWMSGDNTSGSFGIYGTRNVAGASNKPRARLYFCVIPKINVIKKRFEMPLYAAQVLLVEMTVADKHLVSYLCRI